MKRLFSSCLLTAASALTLASLPDLIEAQQNSFTRFKPVTPSFQKVTPQRPPTQSAQSSREEKLKQLGKTIQKFTERPASVTIPSRPAYHPPKETYHPPVVQSRPVYKPESKPAPPAIKPIPIPSKESYQPKPTVPDVAKMISVLKGKPSYAGNQQKPKVEMMDRVVPVNPLALPKGMGTQTYMKKGKSPAESDGGGTATMYMKKGKTPAEGELDRGAPVIVRIKEGRPQAESEAPDTYLSDTSSHFSEPSHPSASSNSGSYSSAPSIAYRVDSSSALATDSVKFLKGSTELADSASYQYLSQLAAALRDPSLANDRFVVEGHASAEGSDSSNLVLSQRRSNAIFDFLISQGVSDDRLLSVGHGEYQARFSASDPEYLRAQDRQVIVFKLAE